MAEVITKIRIVKFPQRHLAFIRHVGPYMGDKELFADLFDKVYNWASPKGLLKNNKVEAITVYHDDPYIVPENEVRISVGYTVPKGTKAEKDIQIMELPEGKYVVGSFEIKPEDYKDAWNQIFDYIKENNFVSKEPMYESYKNDPDLNPEGLHLVDIVVKIKE